MREWKRREACGDRRGDVFNLVRFLESAGSVERLARAEAADLPERRFHDVPTQEFPLWNRALRWSEAPVMVG